MSFSNRLMVIFVPLFKLNGLNAGSSGNMACAKLMTRRHMLEIYVRYAGSHAGKRIWTKATEKMTEEFKGRCNKTNQAPLKGMHHIVYACNDRP